MGLMKLTFLSDFEAPAPVHPVVYSPYVGYISAATTTRRRAVDAQYHLEIEVDQLVFMVKTQCTHTSTH